MSSTELLELPDNFSVDTDLSKELSNISFKDRVAIEEEVHGVRCGATKETAQLLAESLRSFDDKVNAIKDEAEARPEEDYRDLRKKLRNIVRTSSLPKVEKVLPNGTLNSVKSKCYINDDKIRLRFLRSECFDVEKAVARFVHFLDYNSDLFGDFVCERQIGLSDICSSDQEATFKASRCQYLPFRDRSGRRVLAGVGSTNFNFPVIVRCRILMLLHWVVSEDIETQRKGIVILLWPCDEDRGWAYWQSLKMSLTKENAQHQQRTIKAMPVRTASIQMYCEDKPFFHALSAMYVCYAISPERKRMYKAHFGETTELLYKASSYGIPSELIPISYTGAVKFGNQIAMMNFLKTRKQNIIDGGEDSEEIVYCPRSFDVVLRKGTTFRNNPGNTYYRDLIEKYSQKHTNGCKKVKVDITLQVMTEIEKKDGRFLEWSVEKQLWLVIKDRKRVRPKVAAAFKQYERQRKKLQLRQERKQLKKTIDIATDPVRSNKRDTNIALDRNFDANKSLKKYYSDPMAKRQKNTIFNCEDDKICFGKYFYTTDELRNGRIDSNLFIFQA